MSAHERFPIREAAWNVDTYHKMCDEIDRLERVIRGQAEEIDRRSAYIEKRYEQARKAIETMRRVADRYEQQLDGPAIPKEDPVNTDDFGDLSIPFDETINNAYLADKLLQYICPAGEPHTADTPWEDHGHTQCMWIGMAIKRLRAMP